MRLEYYPNESSGITDKLVISPTDEPYQLVRGSMQGFGGVDFQHMSSQSPYQNGASYFMSRSNSRVLSFQIRVYSDTEDDMYDTKLYLSNMLSPAYGEGVLRFYNGKYTSDQEEMYYTLTVVPDGNGQMFQTVDNHDDTMCICNVNMTAFDPFWYNPPEKKVDFGSYVGGFTLPFHLTETEGITLGTGGKAEVNNSGNVPSPCKIYLQNSFDSPIITNKRTGEKIIINKEIHDGETLIINTDPQTSSVTLRSSNGTESNIFNAVSPESAFWQLQPGKNIITCSNSGGTVTAPITIAWYDRFTGVF